MTIRAGTFVIVLLATAVVGLQAVEDRARTTFLPQGQAGDFLYIHSPETLRRASLSYSAVVADLYWIRAVQYYGGMRLASGPKNYDLLYPLLDLTTAADPQFDIAYRFGAIFLAEDFPGGAGRPDLAIALLQKGLRAQPGEWQFAEDIGFVHYWWRRDYTAAAEWFNRAADMPNAAEWLKPLAAVTLAQGANRQSSRRLWIEIGRNAELDWFRRQAQLRLMQLDAMDGIDVVEGLVDRYRQRTGALPASWEDLIRNKALQRVPADPTGRPFRLDPSTGTVTLDPGSPLNPLPQANEQPH